MVRFALALALLGPLQASSAWAATLFFQAAPVTATPICPAPCYEIRMFYEDPTRSLTILGLQFDSDIFGSVTVPELPVPPDTNSNAAGGNTFSEDPAGESVMIPWNLSSTVGRSPDVIGEGLDVLVVDAATILLTVDSVQALRDDTVACTPTSVCEIQSMGLTQNRIYLGRFNVTWNGGRVAVYVSGIVGIGPGFDDPVEGLERLDRTDFAIEGFPPFESADSDRDGVVDSQDNCPSVTNPQQEDRDSDGVGDPCDPCDFSAAPEVDTDGNGIEDGCECGDQNGDGRVDMLDLIAINLAIFNPTQVSPLCDTNNDSVCDVRDIIGANQKIFGRPASCSRYPPPEP